MAKKANWSKSETLVAFRLYCRTPFGRLHKTNPEIIALAAKLGRTPSAVCMKACNFASLDPALQARGIKGLSNASHIEKLIWTDFFRDSTAVALEAEDAYQSLASNAASTPENDTESAIPTGPTEVIGVGTARRVQGFFRSAVLLSYDNRCALTGLAMPDLLNASHIVPWAASEKRRADPRNGICLNALHDRAFDRGLIAFDDDLTVLFSYRLTHVLQDDATKDFLKVSPRLSLPSRFLPDVEALRYHRENVFCK